MEYTTLGQTDISIPRLCLGGMSFGEVFPDFHQWVIGQDETQAVIQRALELGVNFIDTANSVRKFNELAAGLDNTSVVCASADLPFALARFCGAEGIENVTAASGFRSDFGDAFGVTMTEGPLRGLYARSVVVLDENGSVTYTELVPEIGQEPDYDAALAALK